MADAGVININERYLNFEVIATLQSRVVASKKKRVKLLITEYLKTPYVNSEVMKYWN